ncbi:putative UPF0481 protein [Tanacetum coccineum]
MSNNNQGTRNKRDDETLGFLLDCANRGYNRGIQPPPTICSFNPQLVSIGPIHREDDKLQEFEWLKECYLHDLLNRCNKINSTPEKTLLEACLLKVSSFLRDLSESSFNPQLVSIGPLHRKDQKLQEFEWAERMLSS